ncbi:MAG: 8-oxo-dGTP diphosphatase [Anaerolineae bacterium]|nr:8-oxo-dGTP diphosphatase [Anaerolineae bacterium]
MSNTTAIATPAPPHVTECFLMRHNPTQVLLGRKKRGVGEGKIVGIGGKIERGESTVAAAIRELHEEIGVNVEASDLQSRGTVDFCFPNKAAYTMFAHVFVAETWHGEPQETDEIAPVWFGLDELPYAQMWADTPHWLHGMLSGDVNGGHVNAVFVFNDDNATIKSMSFG